MESGDESSFSESEDAFTGTMLYGGALAAAGLARDDAGPDASRKRPARPSGDEDKIQIKFVTHLAEQYVVPQTPFDVPANFGRLGLSEIVNHLLRDRLAAPVPFDFLINGEFLRSSLNAWRRAQGTEQSVTTVEYVKALVAPNEHKDSIHKDWVKAVDCGRSATASVVVTASFDGSLSLFASRDALAAPMYVVPASHGKREPWSVVVVSDHADRVRLLSGGKDCAMRVWDVTPAGHACVQSMALPSQALCVAASADGLKCVAGGANGSLYFYDVEPGSGDGGANVATAAGLTVPLHRDGVTSVAWANAQRCVTSSLDRGVKLLDVDSGICLNALTVSRAATAGALMTPDSAIVGSSEGIMVLCDFRESAVSLTGRASGAARKFKSHTGYVSAVRAHADATHFVSGAYDGHTKLWDVRAAIPLFSLAPVADGDRVLCVGWAGEALLTGGTDRTLRAYEAPLAQ